MREFAPQAESTAKAPPVYRRSEDDANRADWRGVGAPLHRLQQTHGNRFVLRLLGSSLIQTKLKLSKPGDLCEQGADRVADDVTRMAEPEIARESADEDDEMLHRQAGEDEEEVSKFRAGGDVEASGDWKTRIETARGGGQALPEPVRDFFEPRFGRDFGNVRIHTDSHAAESARAINALAYTVGRDVVFGAGQFSPETPAGQRLLAHELTHTIQQRDSPPASVVELGISNPGEPSEKEADLAADAALRSEPVRATSEHAAKVARDVPQTGQPSSTTGSQTQVQTPGQQIIPPLGPSFAQLWSQFEQLKVDHRDAEAMALAPSLARMMSGDDAMNHGLELGQWVSARGDWETARRALQTVETAWWVRFVSIGGNLLRTLGPFGVSPATTLISWATTEAAADRHDRARELFGLAFLMTQMVLQEQSEHHLAGLASIGQLTVDMPMIRALQYSDEQRLIATMREILSFYPNLERRALSIGQPEEADRFADLGKQLRTTLHENYTLLGRGEGTAAITLEASSATIRGREGYALHGVRGDAEVVTPLPGTPLPDELGSHPAYTASMEEVTETLAGQEDFFTRLMRTLEYRVAFGSRPPDLYNLNERLRVWQVMFQSFQRRPMDGCPTALCSLLRLMEQYLRHFTTHTEYNIRDFGQTYLTTQFPEDLLGRTMRDCGVYAVTVAYEVFRTARGATPRLPVGFQLYHTLEHSMLAIFDTDTHTHYVVNNDRISGPNPGDTNDAVAGSIAGAYSGTMGSNVTASIGARSERLTTNLSDAAFSSRIWQNYQVGATLTLRTEPPAGSGDTRTEAQRREDSYKHYYQRMARFSEAGVRVHTQLDELNALLSSRPAADHASLILPRLASLTDDALMIALFFDTYLLNRQAAGLAMDRAAIAVEALGLFTAGTGQSRHPLVRAARLLLYVQGLGQTLTQPQQNLVNGIMSQTVIPSFTQDLTGYQNAGRPASF